MNVLAALVWVHSFYPSYNTAEYLQCCLFGLLAPLSEAGSSFIMSPIPIMKATYAHLVAFLFWRLSLSWQLLRQYRPLSTSALWAQMLKALIKHIWTIYGAPCFY